MKYEKEIKLRSLKEQQMTLEEAIDILKVYKNEWLNEDDDLYQAIDVILISKTGYWIKHLNSDKVLKTYQCSNCGCYIGYKQKFCEECGCRMIGEEDER